MKRNIFFPLIILLMLLISCAVHIAPDSRINWIAREELLSILDERGLVIFDARYSKDWRRSDRKIKGAVRLDAAEVEQMEGFYPLDQKIVLYCA